MNYSEWFKAQTPDRQKAALAHLEVCVANGEAQRAGDWAEVDRLNGLIRAYYQEWKDE